MEYLQEQEKLRRRERGREGMTANPPKQRREVATGL
jgi:hypothetical protein